MLETLTNSQQYSHESGDSVGPFRYDKTLSAMLTKTRPSCCFALFIVGKLKKIFFKFSCFVCTDVVVDT